MHADVISYTRNGNRHISDMRYKLKGETEWRTAYLPSNVKLFTRVEEVYGGGWVTKNGKEPLNIQSSDTGTNIVCS